MQPVTASNAYRLAYETIRNQIISGELMGGTKLVEERLAENIGVSRTPIREAIRHLEQEGFIRNKRVYQPTKEDLIHTFELRILIECHAVKLAAEFMSEEKLKELKQAVIDSKTKNIEQIVNANKRFHSLIISESNNPLIIETANKMNSLIHMFSLKLIQNNRPFLYEEHEGIYKAIQQRHVQVAVELMEQHLKYDLNFMLNL